MNRKFNQKKKTQYSILDKPLLAIQHSMNRGLAKTCAHCFKFLGSLEEQLYFFYEDLGIKDHQFPFK